MLQDYFHDEFIRICKLSDEDLKVEYDMLHTLVYDTPCASWVDVRLYEMVMNEYYRRIEG